MRNIRNSTILWAYKSDKDQQLDVLDIGCILNNYEMQLIALFASCKMDCRNHFESIAAFWLCYTNVPIATQIYSISPVL